MTDLATLVEPLKREVAVPGTFATVFPDTTDPNLVDSLADAFAEAQLLGWFGTYTLTNGETSPDLSAAGGALVVLVAGMRIIRAQLRAITTGERYKAGATEMEINRSAMLLRDELKLLVDRMKDLQRTATRSTKVYQADAYPGRVAFDRVGGFFAAEVR